MERESFWRGYITWLGSPIAELKKKVFGQSASNVPDFFDGEPPVVVPDSVRQEIKDFLKNGTSVTNNKENESLQPSSFAIGSIESQLFKKPAKQQASLYTSFPTTLWTKWHQEAQNTIFVQTSWTGLTKLDDYDLLLLDALKRNVDIKIVLQDPNSAGAIERDRVFSRNNTKAKESEVISAIRENLRWYRKFYPRSVGLPGKFEVKLSDLALPYALYACDNDALLGQFPYLGRMPDFPAFQLRLDDDQAGSEFKKHFMRIWDDANEYNLSLQLDIAG